MPTASARAEKATATVPEPSVITPSAATVIVEPSIVAPPATVTESSLPKARSKTTPSLKTIFNGPSTTEQAAVPTVHATNGPVPAAELRSAWEQYAERRKDQAAEYQILLREYQFKNPVITLTLTNPVEESLLDNFRRDLIQYLRDRFKNNEITVATVMQGGGGKKVIYTSKEKFEHLAEKYPYLNELKDKLGLDWEF